MKITLSQIVLSFKCAKVHHLKMTKFSIISLVCPTRLIYGMNFKCSFVGRKAMEINGS
ncbi:MAG: hypothetical protein K2L19_03165 [Eubacterium sp.]|nr:hypothetical protein [Eubacterium sp.]